MGLKDTQKLLTQLYTDASFREEFFLQPDALLKKYSFNNEEISGFKSLDYIIITKFANSLIHKRITLLLKYLPLAVNLLGKELEEALFIYANQHPKAYLKTKNATLEDGFNFLKYMKHYDCSLPSWGISLIRYELIRKKLESFQNYFKASFFPHSINLITQGMPKKQISVLICIKFWKYEFLKVFDLL